MIYRLAARSGRGFTRNDIAALVADDQIPGSFGDLIKRSVGLIEEGKELEGGNVVSMVGRQHKE